MNTGNYIDGLTDFSTAPDAIFSLCGVSIIAGLIYTLIRISALLVFAKRDNVKCNISEGRSEISKNQSDQYWLKSFLLSGMMMGAMRFVGDDKRYDVIGDVFGATILGYHFAGLLLSMVIASFIIILVNDTRKGMDYIKNKKQAQLLYISKACLFVISRVVDHLGCL